MRLGPEALREQLIRIGLNENAATAAMNAFVSDLEAFTLSEAIEHTVTKSKSILVSRDVESQSVFFYIWLIIASYDIRPTTQAERKQTSRRKSVDERSPGMGRTISRLSYAISELMRWLIHGNGCLALKKDQYSTSENAASTIVSWLNLLRLENTPSEDSRRKLQKRIQRIYRESSASQVPERKRGVLLPGYVTSVAGDRVVNYSSDSELLSKNRWPSAYDRQPKQSRKRKSRCAIEPPDNPKD